MARKATRQASPEMKAGLPYTGYHFQEMPFVNGITMLKSAHGSSNCFCEKGVTGVSHNNAYQTCLIPRKGQPYVLLTMATLEDSIFGHKGCFQHLQHSICHKSPSLGINFWVLKNHSCKFSTFCIYGFYSGSILRMSSTYSVYKVNRYLQIQYT